MKFSIMQLIWLAALCVTQIAAHGMLLDPPGRSSRWREDKKAPINYNDNALFCGGYGALVSYGGKCGLCGDNYAVAPPRPNEIGGKYGGVGVITRTYWNTSMVELVVRITANHLGYFIFDLCNLDEFGQESEQCFAKYPLKLFDGSQKYFIGSKTGNFIITALLPEGLACQHCVLRWSYIAGNNWGICEDGRGKMGCGLQETFKNCADISLISNKNLLKTLAGEIDVHAAIPPAVPETY